MYNIILNPLSQFEIIDFLYFEASLIDNIHISLAKIGLYVILSLVFFMILTIFFSNLNWLVSNNLSIFKESMYSLIRKGLWTHGFKFFAIFFSIRLCFCFITHVCGERGQGRRKMKEYSTQPPGVKRHDYFDGSSKVAKQLESSALKRTVLKHTAVRPFCQELRTWDQVCPW